MDILAMVIEYIMDKALILVPVLYVIGYIVKNMSIINDKYIPVILLGFGILGAISIMGVSPDAIFQGVLVTGATVFFNQVKKQLVNKK